MKLLILSFVILFQHKLAAQELEISSSINNQNNGVDLFLESNTEDLYCSQLNITVFTYQSGSRRLVNTSTSNFNNVYLHKNSTVKISTDNSSVLSNDLVIGRYEVSYAEDCWSIPSFLQKCKYANLTSAEENSISSAVTSSGVFTCDDFVRLSPYHIELAGSNLDTKIFSSLDFISSLRFSDSSLEILPSLQNFIHLKQLDISNSNIRNIDQLSNLKRLEAINLSNLKLDNLNALLNLESLEYIDLRNTSVDNLVMNEQLSTACILTEGMSIVRSRENQNILREIQSSSRRNCRGYR